MKMAAYSDPVREDPYVAWLKHCSKPLFEAGGAWWTTYRNALVPAAVRPTPLNLTQQQGEELLARSGAYFLRYFTRMSTEPTGFWYSTCEEYSAEKLTGKMRSHIRRAYRGCSVRQIEPQWLAANGYECYTAAYSRYTNARPDSPEVFVEKCNGAAGGPFEFWGVFVNGALAGFTKCVVGNDYVSTLVLKLDPDYLRAYPAYALRDTILRTYVSEQGKPVLGGFRSVAHDTNMHEFVKQFGYRRVYCDLKIVYRSPLRYCLNVLYPFKPLICSAPDVALMSRVKALLAQEEIRRSFL